MGIRAHTAFTARGELTHRLARAAILVEELLGLIAAHPRLELGQMVGIRSNLADRQLVRSEGAFDTDAIHDLRSGPNLRSTQDHHRPGAPSLVPPRSGTLLNRRDLVERVVEGLGDALMDVHR